MAGHRGRSAACKRLARWVVSGGPPFAKPGAGSAAARGPLPCRLTLGSVGVAGKSLFAELTESGVRWRGRLLGPGRTVAELRTPWPCLVDDVFLAAVLTDCTCPLRPV